MRRIALLAATLATFGLNSLANAAAMLRVSCEEDAVGAEIIVNGKLKGECPLDIKVPEGMVSLIVQKKVDKLRERVFRQQFRMGDGTVKSIEAQLGPVTLNAEGERQEAERIASLQRLDQATLMRQRQAAESGDGTAMLELGDRFAEGVGVGQNYEEAKSWYSKAATAGNQAATRKIMQVMSRICPTCIEMARIEAGSFDMGTNQGHATSGPMHRVSIPAFSIAKTEVTQRQWRAVTGNSPSKVTGCDDCPVENVSWAEIQDFLRKLNTKTGKRFRLPSEAEWEYACRAGKDTTYCGDNELNRVAWGNDGKPHPVGEKQANGFGLYDMSGNVGEMLPDCYNKGTYGGFLKQNAPTDGSAWTNDGCHERMIRGGAFDKDEYWARTTSRAQAIALGARLPSVGFRLAAPFDN